VPPHVFPRFLARFWASAGHSTEWSDSRRSGSRRLVAAPVWAPASRTITAWLPLGRVARVRGAGCGGRLALGACFHRSPAPRHVRRAVIGVRRNVMRVDSHTGRGCDCDERSGFMGP